MLFQEIAVGILPEVIFEEFCFNSGIGKESGRHRQAIVVRPSSSGRRRQAVVVRPSLAGIRRQAVIVRPSSSGHRRQAVVVRPYILMGPNSRISCF